MKAISKNVFKVAILAIVLAQLPGCIGQNLIISAVGSAVASSYPTFETTEQAWPELSTDTGRIVIYWPGPTAGEVLLGGPIVRAEVRVDDNEDKLGIIGNRTFVFVDLTPEQHTINFVIHQGMFQEDNKTSVSVDVRAGEIDYLKLHATGAMGFQNLDPPVIVEAAEAREALNKLHHNYEDPVPLAQQKEGAMPAI